MDKNQNIAIVCGHFMPEVGYVEVQLAKALYRLGKNVHVFTSTVIPNAIKSKLPVNFSYKAGTSSSLGYQITRLVPFFTLGQMVKCRGVLNHVLAFQPDIIIIIGLGKLFPKPILKHSFINTKLIVLLADNEDSFDQFSGLKGGYSKLKKIALRKVFKDPIYKLAVKNVNQFFAYTPSAPSIVLKYLPKNQHPIFLSNVTPLSLGFDDEDFYYDEKLRVFKRAEMNFLDTDIVLITATRITPFKSLEKIIDVVDEINNNGISFKYIIAGFGNDAYSEKLKNYIAKKKYSNQFITFPFLPHKNLLELYNASDIGYWSSHIITHYQAMGTGLPLILPNKKNIEHIIEHDSNGWKLNDKEIYTTFNHAISQIALFKEKRKLLADVAKQKFAFTTIAQKLL
ncbi:MAG: glycosyltransferase [Vicingaceae bacterium]|nr:glycosyltransferase [Vicingaceae bacterium]